MARPNTVEVTIQNYTDYEGRYAVGHYYIDEAEQIDGNGPYSSEQEALDALDVYVKEFMI